MKTASVADVRSKLGAILKASEKTPVVITRNGRPVAVIVGVQDEAEVERLLEAKKPKLADILERSRQQIRDGQFLSEEEFWSQVDKESSEQSTKPRKKRA
jgi:prevent-host-death family protein